MRSASPIPRWQRVLWRAVWFVGWVLNRVGFRLRATGHRDLPREGPYLLLPNHTSFFDPLWVAHPLWRPVRFMASEHLFRLRWAPLVRAIGAFPKKKFVSDRRAVVSLMRFLRGGAVVVVFPEGSRNWDGRTLPILPGLGHLVMAAKVPVVYARVTTGHYVQPRWARYPRYVPVHVEYDGPHIYEGCELAEIEADAQRRITVDPSIPVPRGSFGWRMAHGLPAYLWACPHCFAIAGLTVHPQNDDAVRCESCGASWAVDVAQVLTPLPGGPEGVASTTVRDAYDALCEHFASSDGRPVADAEALEHRGVFFEGDGVVSVVADDGARTVAAEGRLELRADVLEVPASGWSVALDRVQGLSMEAGSRLQFRAGGRLYELESERPSTVAWHHFVSGGRRTP